MDSSFQAQIQKTVLNQKHLLWQKIMITKSRKLNWLRHLNINISLQGSQKYDSLGGKND